MYTTHDLSLTRAVVARQAEAVGDDGASVRVYIVVVVLVVIGVSLAALAIWLVRQTRPDRELLAPLERMDGRRWRDLDPQDRRRSLDEVRPAGAFPIDRAKREPDVDSDFASARPLRDFSDLADDGSDLADDGDDPTGDIEGGAEAGLAADSDTPEADDSDDATGVGFVVTGDATSVDDPAPKDPLVIDTELLDPSLLASNEPVVPLTADSEATDGSGQLMTADRAAEDPDDDPTVPTDRPGRHVIVNGDDTGEHPSEADLDVPLMPGEGLLRRPRTDADLT